MAVKAGWMIRYLEDQTRYIFPVWQWMDLIHSFLVHKGLKNHPKLVESVFMSLLHGIQMRVSWRMGLLEVRRLSYFFPEPRGQIHHQQRCKFCSLEACTVCFAITTPRSYMFSLRLIDQHIHMVHLLAAHARPLGLRFPPPTFPFPKQPPKTGHRVSPRIPPVSRDCKEAFAILPCKGSISYSPRMKVWLRVTLPKRTANTVTQQ